MIHNENEERGSLYSLEHIALTSFHHHIYDKPWKEITSRRQGNEGLLDFIKFIDIYINA